jgi:acyl carrier protein
MESNNKIQWISYIKELLSQYSNIPTEKIIETMVFGKDIIINSIEMGEIIMIIKEKYPHIDQKKIFLLKTVQDLLKLCLWD